MEIIGLLAVIVLSLVVLIALFWVVRSIPDINRYRRLRRM